METKEKARDCVSGRILIHGEAMRVVFGAGFTISGSICHSSIYNGDALSCLPQAPFDNWKQC